VKHLRVLKSMLYGSVVALIILGASIGVFVLVYGWARFLEDFWPLDNSRVGPNLCASLVGVVALVAHSEYRIVENDLAKGRGVRDVAHDTKVQILHPIEDAEKNIANDVADALSKDN